MASFQPANDPSFSSGISSGPCSSCLLPCPPPPSPQSLTAPPPPRSIPATHAKCLVPQPSHVPPGALSHVSAHGWHYCLLQEASLTAVLPAPDRPQGHHVASAWPSSSNPSWRRRAGSDAPSPEEGRPGGPWTVLGSLWGDSLSQTMRLRHRGAATRLVPQQRHWERTQVCGCWGSGTRRDLGPSPAAGLGSTPPSRLWSLGTQMLGTLAPMPTPVWEGQTGTGRGVSTFIDDTCG